MSGRSLVIVVDGLRPDSINGNETPNLAALRRRGVWFANAHASVPPVTLLNGAVLATGRHPASTGIVGNRMFVPSVDAAAAIQLTDANGLVRVADATGGIVLGPSLADHLDKHGKRLAVVGSGSAGTTLCASPGAHTGVGVTISCDDPSLAGPLAVPDDVGDEVLARFGPPPSKRGVGDRMASVRYAIQVMSEYVLPAIDPDVAILWLTEPDFTQHAFHVGSPASSAVLRHVDAGIGALVESLDRTGRLDGTNVIVISDHGCTQMTSPAADVEGVLVSAGLKTAPDSNDVIVVNNGSVGIHVPGREAAHIAEIVRLLQRQQWSGALFTAAGTSTPAGLGSVDGTFSFELVHLADARGCPDILLTPAWTATCNGFGVVGQTHFPSGLDRSNHGSLSPWDIASTMIAAGPGFAQETVVSTPVGNVDLVPTLLALTGTDDDLESLDGRVLAEAFRERSAAAQPRTAHTQTQTLVTSVGATGYRAALRATTVGATRYIDKGWRLPDR